MTREVGMDPKGRPVGVGSSVRRGAGLKVAVIAGVAGLAVGGGYLMLRGGAGPGVQSAGARTSDLVAVKKTSFEIATKCSGELEARNQIEVRSKLESQSTIVELAPEGKSVKAGELLVRLNSDKIEQDILEQTLQVESARAELVAAENGYDIQVNENKSKLRQAESKVTLAQLALEQWEKGDVETKRLELKLASEKATRDLARLEDKLEQSKKLYAQGFLSKNERDLDEIAFTEAKAAVDKSVIATNTYENYTHRQEQETKTSALTEARAEFERVQMNNVIDLASKEAARTNRRKQLAVREEKLKNLQTQLAAATMNAPSDGLVVYATSMNSGRMMFGGNDGPLQIGRQVFPNELLMILPDTSDMMASVRVQESLAGRVRPGQAVTVQVDAAGGKTFAGKVESTSVLAETGGWRDPNLREYTVKVALDQPSLLGAGLKPSMRVDASITLGEVDDALSVPVQAVFNEGQVRYVYVQRGSRFVKSPVKMGRRSDTFAEIAAGVDESDIVLLREPSAGEVIVQPWDKGKLELAGYTVGEDGQPVAGGDPRKPGSGGMPGNPGQRTPRGKGRPGGEPQTAQKPAAEEQTQDLKPKESPDKGAGLAERDLEKTGEGQATPLPGSETPVDAGGKSTGKPTLGQDASKSNSAG